jgi:hypothetical protein
MLSRYQSVILVTLGDATTMAVVCNRLFLVPNSLQLHNIDLHRNDHLMSAEATFKKLPLGGPLPPRGGLDGPLPEFQSSFLG